jgi:hypothetical protein
MIWNSKTGIPLSYFLIELHSKTSITEFAIIVKFRLRCRPASYRKRFLDE